MTTHEFYRSLKQFYNLSDIVASEIQIYTNENHFDLYRDILYAQIIRNFSTAYGRKLDIQAIREIEVEANRIYDETRPKIIEQIDEHEKIDLKEEAINLGIDITKDGWLVKLVLQSKGKE